MKYTIKNTSGTTPHKGARDEDADVPSLEALIQAVLNNNTEAIEAVESLDCVLLALRIVTVQNPNSSLSRWN